MSESLTQDLGLNTTLARAVRRRARNEGMTLAQYVRWLIERDLLADKNFDDILKPIRADFRKSGLNEARLDEIVERARNKTYRAPVKAHP